MAKAPRQTPQSRHSNGFRIPKLIWPEGERQSWDEWYEEREVMFEELRNIGISDEYIDPVRNGSIFLVVHYTPVEGQAKLFRAELAKPRKLTEVQIKDDQGPSPYCAPNVYVTREELPATSGELFAYLLRGALPRLQRRQRTRRIQPEGADGLFRAIKYAAMDLLDRYQIATRAPGPQLNELLRELLDLNRPRHGVSRNFAARYYAAEILARIPAISIRQLAASVEVQPSTVKRWLDEPTDNPRSFTQQVAKVRKARKMAKLARAIQSRAGRI